MSTKHAIAFGSAGVVLSRALWCFVAFCSFAPAAASSEQPAGQTRTAQSESVPPCHEGAPVAPASSNEPNGDCGDSGCCANMVFLGALDVAHAMESAALPRVLDRILLELAAADTVPAFPAGAPVDHGPSPPGLRLHLVHATLLI